ncbi:hypothetical protein GcC1_151010 [Golovinomyces cichoracearum]|uniref:Retrotransposon gag domain-containing protein n=1 Tax=Golovinomyces cichoracearum TaxID=62708 RepID=A0A420HWZ7_9PEZI|nr:hypothetical protein GcC1_151010 [Golovinomyces cichoracearum]
MPNTIEAESSMKTTKEMADFDKIGLCKGIQPANRWLARLEREMKIVGGQATPEELFEAEEILIEDDAATWVDSSPRYRRIIDNRKYATDNDVMEFEEALRIQFPSRNAPVLEERSWREEIKNFNQKLGESLKEYYGRTQELLRRGHARDERMDGVTTLSPIEAVMLSVVVSAFLKGINDYQVRTAVLMRSKSISKSLRTA